MNNVFTAKLLNNLRNKKGDKGFTLIELLVVVIIIGVLAAVALPNLLGQVAKGRQAEAKNNLGAINRSQQAHRLEEARFGVIEPGNVQVAVPTQPGPDGTLGTADDVPAVPGIQLLPIRITGDNYAYTDQMTEPTATDGAQQATAIADLQNDILDYSAAVGQDAAGNFISIICENAGVNGRDAQGNAIAGAAAPVAVDQTTAGVPSCGTASIRL